MITLCCSLYSIIVKAFPSTAALLAFNHFLKILKHKLKLSAVPHALVTFHNLNLAHMQLMHELYELNDFFLKKVGMFAVLTALVSLKHEHAEKFVELMKPGVDLLTLFLPSFFIPALVVAPLSLSAMSG